MNSFGGISLDRTSDNNENGTYSVTFNIRGEALPVPIELHVTHSETFVIGDTVSNIVNEIKNNMIELGREIKNDFDNFVFDHYIVPILDNGL
jgi:hypothetical protein